MPKVTIEAWASDQVYELISAILDALKNWNEDMVKRWLIETYPEVEENL